MKRYLVLALVVPIVALIAMGLLLKVSLSPVEEICTGPAEATESNWTLVVDGLVERPLNLTFNEIAAMPSASVVAKLQCVDDRPGLRAVTANWTGVPLKILLDKAGISPKAIKVAFCASDGFSTDITVETAMRQDMILAYQKDGEFLPGWGGAPALRLVVPGKWGYKWITWVVRIKVVDFDYRGTWESRGYSDEADIP